MKKCPIKKTTISPFQFTFLITILFFFNSCTKEEDLPEIKPGSNNNSVCDNDQQNSIKEGYLYGAKIKYQVINGRNIFSGDIILADHQISNIPPNNIGVEGAVVAQSPTNRWPNSVIPFTIDPNFPDQFRITAAIADWTAHTPFRFVARTTESDFVTFVPTQGDVSSSFLGRIGGQQYIEISNYGSAGTIIHEIGHLVGLFHEHQRVDRDNYVIIHPQNMIAGYGIAAQFETYQQWGRNGYDVEPFDFGSIMMYGSGYFSTNPYFQVGVNEANPTITKLDNTVFSPNTTALSPLDMDVATTVTGFTQWVNLGGNIASKPVAISRFDNSVNVFARGQANQLMHIYWAGNAWSNWIDLGGSFQDAPAASRRGTGIVDVFVRGNNNHLLHRYWQNNSWSNWTDLGGNIASSPSAISRTNNTINIFAKGQNGELLHISWNGSNWSAWENLGGNITSEPAVSSRGVNSLDVFCKGPNNQLMQKSWNGSSWLSWIDLGGQLASAPTAVSWGSNRIDIYYRAVNGMLEHKWWENNAWDKRPFGGLFTFGAAAVTSQRSESINLFGINSSNQLMHKWYE